MLSPSHTFGVGGRKFVRLRRFSVSPRVVTSAATSSKAAGGAGTSTSSSPGRPISRNASRTSVSRRRDCSPPATPAVRRTPAASRCLAVTAQRRA